MSYTPLRTSSHSFKLHSDGKYTYAYGPPGLVGILQNKRTLFYAGFASLGGLTFGYDQGVIATVLVMTDFVSRFPVGAWEKGLMTAVLELGALVGSLCAGTLSERMSRTGAISIACIVFSFGSLLQCLATHINHLIVGRAIGGIGVGALSMLCPLYLAEISPPEARGTIMVAEQFSIVLGVVIGYWLGFFTRSIPGSSSWRIPLGAQLIPGILLGIGCLGLPQSPRLLILRGLDSAGRAVLKKLRLQGAVETDDETSIPAQLVELEFLEIQAETQLIHESELSLQPRRVESNNAVGRELSQWTKLFGPRYRTRVMIGVMIMFYQQWSGVNALIYYAPSLISSLGLDPDGEGILIAAGLVSITQFLAVFPALIFIDRFGRRTLLRTGALIMTLAHGGIASLSFLFGQSWEKSPLAALTAIACVYIFTFAYGVSFGPVGWVLPGEVIPLEVRGRGVGISTATNWLNNFIIGLITPRMLQLSPTLTFVVFATACAAAEGWVVLQLPETANVPLEDMAKIFGEDDMSGRKREIEEEIGIKRLVQEIASAEEGEVDDHVSDGVR